MALLCPRCKSRFDGDVERCPNDGKRLVRDRTGQEVGGRYTLRSLLGVGGMESSVWLAWQASTEREVAIKLISTTDDASIERFARGARIACQLNHPNITVVHDYGRTAEGELYLVMERLEGQSLHREVRRGPLAVDRVLHIANQVLRALDHAHAKGVVHRDIKPGNLFLVRQNDDPDGLKMLDFGIARFVDTEEDAPSAEITTARQVCGTPHYMAPEQVTFGQVDARTDLYALGVVLFRMLTGRLPFIGDDHRDLFRQHVYSDPPSFTDVRPEAPLPAELEAFVMKALAKSPDDRYPNAKAMRAALKEVRKKLGLVLSGNDEATPFSQAGMTPEPPIEIRRSKLPYVLLFVGVAAAAALVVWLLRTPPVEPAPRVAAIPAQPDAARVAVVDAGAPDAGWVPVKISSIPEGASIVWRDAAIGVTPATVRLPPGTHALTLVRDKVHKTVTVSTGVQPAPLAFPELVPDAAAPPPRPRPIRRPPRKRPLAKRVERAQPDPAPEVKPDPVVATPPPAKKTVKMELLDGSGASEYEVGKKKPAAKPPAREPDIDLLD